MIDRLREEPYRFDFFQAVRLLTRVGDGLEPVGLDGPFSREVVRFVQYLSLNFPASALDAIEGLNAEEGRGPGDGSDRQSPPKLTTTFIGLVGPCGVLPTVYTEALVGPQGRKRTAAVDFFNLFHHRIASLFYRAWEKYDLPSQWEKAQRPAALPGDDAFQEALFHLIGLGPEPLRDRMAVPDDSLPFYTGILAHQHRSAVMLERLLVDYFGRPTRVVSFVGRWLRLRPEEQTRLGRRGAFNRLGSDAVAGRRVWDLQSKFRVRVGPLSRADFEALLPGGSASAPLLDLVRFYDRGEFDFDVQLVLRKEEVPSCLVSKGPEAARLGRSAWLKRREFARDADDAVVKAG